MPTPTLESILRPEEYRELSILAEQEGRTVEDLLHDAVREILDRRRPPVDLTQDPSFGMWSDDPRSDEELLSDLGGCWRGVGPACGSAV